MGRSVLFFKKMPFPAKRERVPTHFDTHPTVIRSGVYHQSSAGFLVESGEWWETVRVVLSAFADPFRCGKPHGWSEGETIVLQTLCRRWPRADIKCTGQDAL